MTASGNPPRERLPDGTFMHGLTPARHKALVKGCRLGLFDKQNAMRCGIDVSTLQSWVERGLDEDAAEPFRSFAEDYLRASIELEESIIAKVLSAAEEFRTVVHSTETVQRLGNDEDDDFDSSDLGPGTIRERKKKHGTQTRRGDWRAAAWFAERRWPLRWGNRSPENGPKEALRLPDGSVSRQRKLDELTSRPSPELVKRFRDKGYALVKIETPPSLDDPLKSKG